MAISFYCPTCQNFCSSGEESAGKHAACQACGQEFMIPDEDGGQALKVKSVRDNQPMPGFWQAAFRDSAKLLTVGGNATGAVFVCAAMGFKFFCGHGNIRILVFYIPIGFITQIISWGCICWYLMCVITAVYEEQDELPDIEIGFGFEFFGNVFKSICLFIYAFLIPIIPFLLLSKLSVILVPKLFSGTNVDISLFKNWFVFCGVFFFPISVLLITVARGLWMVFWPMNIIRPIVKSPLAYIFTASVVVLSAAIHLMVYNYVTVRGESDAVIAMHLAANLGAGLFSIIAMRIVGLFGRHFSCYLPE